MLQERALYDHELAAARASLSGVKWHADFLEGAKLECGSCGSELLEQTSPDNESQGCIEFRCRNCAATPDAADVFEAAVQATYGVDEYLRTKDAGEDGPIYDCPVCERHTYLEDEEICANCGEGLDFTSECARCSNAISIQDYLDGLDGGLCGYCAHVADKVMRE